MWQTTQPPIETRVLVSSKGKVWIGRFRRKWDSCNREFTETYCWSLDGKTIKETENWIIDGWAPTPEAINAKPPREPLTYLDCLEFSIRAHNVLKREGKTTKEEIEKLTLEELLSFKNMGRLSANEVLEWRDKPYQPLLDRLNA